MWHGATLARVGSPAGIGQPGPVRQDRAFRPRGHGNPQLYAMAKANLGNLGAVGIRHVTVVMTSHD